MSGLGLVPNKIIGYRIVPDWNSFNVQIIKRRSDESKNPIKEYGEPVAYCRSLEFAAQFIVQHATRVFGEEMQDAQQKIDGTVGSVTALSAAIVKAQETAVAAVRELQARIEALGYNRRSLVHALEEGNIPADGAVAAESA